MEMLFIIIIIIIITDNSSICVDDTNLERAYKFNYLGVQMDCPTLL